MSTPKTEQPAITPLERLQPSAGFSLPDPRFTGPREWQAFCHHFHGLYSFYPQDESDLQAWETFKAGMATLATPTQPGPPSYAVGQEPLSGALTFSNGSTVTFSCASPATVNTVVKLFRASAPEPPSTGEDRDAADNLAALIMADKSMWTWWPNAELKREHLAGLIRQFNAPAVAGQLDTLRRLTERIEAQRIALVQHNCGRPGCLCYEACRVQDEIEAAQAERRDA